jgi:hypothetical protein
MSLTPAAPSDRRDWTLPMVTGVAALVALLVVCAVGSTATYLVLRGDPAPPPSSGPPVMPSPSAKASPAPPPASSGRDCLIGDWLQTSWADWATIFGTRVQLSAKGAMMRLAADGTSIIVYENVVSVGTASGDNYEVIHNGTIQTNYVADETTILSSNPRAEGTTTWKVNGKVRESQKMGVTLNPETYKCQGDDLRTFSGESATEWRRIRPPGTPA